ncbi:MAG: TldD/PmbA family protein [Nanoarchaeota archaeon]|nr:TldD/PmbA family protein [Nanoarchaeota archaeon]
MKKKNIEKYRKDVVDMDYDLADFAIETAQKHGADYAEARLESTEGDGFLLKNGIPQVSGFDLIKGIGMRFLVKNAMSSFCTNVLDKKSIEEGIIKAIKSANASKRINEKIEFAKEPSYKANYQVKEKIKLADIGPDEKISLLYEIQKKIAQTKVRTMGTYLSLSTYGTERYFTNNEGSRIISKIPRTNFFYYVTVEEKGQSAQRFWQYGSATGWEYVKEMNYPEILKTDVLALSSTLKNGKRAPTGNLDVVCGPQVVGIMVHESVGHPYEADRILGREAAQAGESFLSPDKIGYKIGSDVVNVVDDPTIENSYGYYLYDDEGVKARPKNLIKNGVITEFLHNRSTAAELGVKSNAAARVTHYDREPIVRMSNTMVVPGDQTEEELISGIKNGIYMKNFMEWNIDDKRLNQKYVGSESYLIKNGQITDPIKWPAIEIETPQLWSSVDGVAKNTELHAGSCGKGEPMQAIPVLFGGPSIRLRNIRLSLGNI